MTIDEALGDLRDSLSLIHKALSHPTREVRPADAAFTSVCKAIRMLQFEVRRLRESRIEVTSYDKQAMDALAEIRCKLARVEALLARIVKYAHEDRAMTPGTTRLARALEEAEAALKDPP